MLKQIAEKQEDIVSVSKCVVVQGGKAAYERIKHAVMKWDMYGGVTKVYLKSK